MTGNRIAVEATYKGCRVKDRLIELAARRMPDGSGTNAGGVRDITFSFYQRPAAQRAVDRINKLIGVKARILPD